MRVISGRARGRVLKSLEGEATRPTTDKVKESIFNIIQFDIEGSSVLDLFGGSGQLAIEAVSRGAERAVICEKSPQAVKIIRENVKVCGFADKIDIYHGDYSQLLTKGIKYDVIFLDPPYDSVLMSAALSGINKFDMLSENGIIVCETDIGTEIEGYEEPSYTRREYKYGRIKLTIIRKADL